MKPSLIPILIILLFGTIIFSGFSNRIMIETEPTEELKVKNVILIIGDGMGFEQLKLASLVEYGTENGLFMHSTDFIQSEIETSSSEAIIPDSASTATSLATGVKTHRRAIGVDRDDVAVPTILEYAETLGKSTGLVSSMRFNDATPAAFAAHVPDRGDLFEMADQISISGIEVVLGGGTDWTPLNSLLIGEGYTIVQTKQALLDIDTADTSKLWGNYQPRNLLYEAEMDYSNNVRLLDLVNVSLDILANNPNGFFTMIEGGLIDFAGHGEFEPSNQTRNALETIHLDKVVKYVMDWVADHNDTMVIVTSDHETGGLSVDDTLNLDSNITNQSQSEELKRQRRIERSKQIEVSWSTTYHTSQNVPFMAFGKHADQLVNPDCEYSNANVYGVMRNALDGVIPTQCPVFIEGSQPPTKTISSISSQLSFTTSSTITTSNQSSSLPESQSSNQNNSTFPNLFLMIIVLFIPRKLKRIIN
ncbi:MAG: alkaline phosphatase [Candidatus Heimdallarchaeota archaeon]|nr:alkaline phosphatase [Candidatus Heimdallarchaeota archaeon]